MVNDIIKILRFLVTFFKKKSLSLLEKDISFLAKNATGKFLLPKYDLSPKERSLYKKILLLRIISILLG